MGKISNLIERAKEKKGDKYIKWYEDKDLRRVQLKQEIGKIIQREVVKTYNSRENKEYEIVDFKVEMDEEDNVSMVITSLFNRKTIRGILSIASDESMSQEEADLLAGIVEKMAQEKTGDSVHAGVIGYYIKQKEGKNDYLYNWG